MTSANEINQLHNKILNAARTSIEDAIRIGELLTNQKAKVEHGQWLPWVESNLQFDARQAQRYMRVFEQRGELANASSKSHLTLTDALRLLTEPSDRVIRQF